MAVLYSLKKRERLCSRKAISKLFDSGEAFNVYPFRVFWKISDEELPSPAQFAVSASKKNFKSAVDRNRIKRLTREAWRLNKHILYSYLGESKQQLTLMLVYTETTMPDYHLINKKVAEIISKLLLFLPDKERTTKD